MLLLALDTATDVCAVALARDGHVVAERQTDAPRAHAARLAPFVSEVLGEAGASARDLDAVAVSAGPGSFTGLRIGLSTAKGLCLATGARLVLVPTLDALVAAARDAGAVAPGARAAAVVSSRRGEVYLGGDGVAPRAVALVDLGAALGGGPVAIVGPAAGVALTACLGVAITGHTTQASPRALARLAADRLGRGLTDRLDTAEPLYVQPFAPSRPAGR